MMCDIETPYYRASERRMKERTLHLKFSVKRLRRLARVRSRDQAARITLSHPLQVH